MEEYIKECFEQHRNQLKHALEDIQNKNDIFMKNIITLLKIQSPVLPPKDKEEMGEMGEEGEDKSSPSSPPSSPSSSESSIHLEEDSSSIHLPPPPLMEDDDDYDYVEDDFVVNSDEEPPIFPKPIMDKAHKEWIEREVGNKKRNRKRAHHWSPDDHKHEKIGKSKTTYDGYVSGDDRKEFKDFQYHMSGVYGYDYIYRNSIWFQKKYGKAMDTIINSAGREGSNVIAKANFRRIIDKALSLDDIPTIEKKRLGGPGLKICCLCGEKKHCPNTLWFSEPCDDGMTPHPIASCCAKLAYATIEFFKSLPNSSFGEVDLLFQDIQEAHAQKGEERKR